MMFCLSVQSHQLPVSIPEILIWTGGINCAICWNCAESRNGITWIACLLIRKWHNWCWSLDEQRELRTDVSVAEWYLLYLQSVSMKTVCIMLMSKTCNIIIISVAFADLTGGAIGIIEISFTVDVSFNLPPSSCAGSNTLRRLRK